MDKAALARYVDEREAEYVSSGEEDVPDDGRGPVVEAVEEEEEGDNVENEKVVDGDLE